VGVVRLETYASAEWHAGSGSARRAERAVYRVSSHDLRVFNFFSKKKKKILETKLITK